MNETCYKTHFGGLGKKALSVIYVFTARIHYVYVHVQYILTLGTKCNTLAQAVGFSVEVDTFEDGSI